MHELVILSLGSNLGDREENLASAITLLGTFNEISNIKGRIRLPLARAYETGLVREYLEKFFISDFNE